MAADPINRATRARPRRLLRARRRHRSGRQGEEQVSAGGR
jgi:hypothetical protein